MKHIEGQIAQSVPAETAMIAVFFAGKWAGRTVGVRYIEGQIAQSVSGGD